MNELLIGCGHRKQKIIWHKSQQEWTDLTTLDINPDCKPDKVHDLNVFPYPFKDNSFDEIHAYEVLEHCGKLGDIDYFFKQWNEFYRILKPAGRFYATVPDRNSVWAWGDPSHTRVVQREQLWFLSKKFYENLGNSASSDFRRLMSCDFHIEADKIEEGTYYFMLTAVK